MKIIHPCLIALLILTTITGVQAQQVLSPEERLARLEQLAVTLLEDIRQIRADMNQKPGSSTRGLPEAPSAPEMQPGVLAKIFVRTGEVDPYSPPPDKASPSDTRLHAGSSFNPGGQAKAAGYGGQMVTVVWDGFFKVEEAGVYEFLLESRYATAQIGPKSLNSRGEKTVRLDLKPGFWPIMLRDGVQARRYTSDVILRVKRSGLDPVAITPGSLWTQKKD